MKKMAALLGVALLCALFVLGVYVPNEDLVMHLQTADRIGLDLVYGVTTREMNPPLFYYLLKLPLAMSRLMDVWAGHVYLLLTGLLLGVCAQTLRPSFLILGFSVRQAFWMALSFILLFTLSQNYQFTQKEALMAILSLPGLLLLTVRATVAQEQQACCPPSWRDHALVLMAALGLLIKPQFILVMGVPLLVLLLTYRRYVVYLLPSLVLIGAAGALYAVDLWRTGWVAYYLQHADIYRFYGYLDMDRFIGFTIAELILTTALCALWWMVSLPRERFFVGVWSVVAFALLGGAVVQLNGSPYHYIPFYFSIYVILILVVLGVVRATRAHKAAYALFIPVLFFVALLTVGGLYFFGSRTRIALEETRLYAWMTATMERQPFSSFAYVGAVPGRFHAVVGMHDLAWGLRTPCLWDLPSAVQQYVGEWGTRAQGAAELKRIGDAVALDLVEFKPEVIVSCGSEPVIHVMGMAMDFLKVSPAFTAAVSAYQVEDEQGLCRLMRRHNSTEAK